MLELAETALGDYTMLGYGTSQSLFIALKIQPLMPVSIHSKVLYSREMQSKTL